jgi:hypothetical protein
MPLSEQRQDLRVLLLLPFPPRLDATHGGARAIAYLVQARRKWQKNEYSQISALFGQHHVSRAAGARLNGSIL